VSLIDLMLAAEAAQAHAAVRRTAYRHQHLAETPLVVVAYNLSGEAAAPLGIMYGTDPDAASASLAVAAEPRNRDSRFGAINAFAADLVDFVEPFLSLKTVPTKSGGFRQITDGAPQVVVPNRGTRSYLGARLGRSLRYLGLGETHDVPEATQWAGAHLSWMAEHGQLPGQSTFLAMTESLSQHFVTGQSALEDENLATLLAWIDGVPGDLLGELELLEERAYGPVPNPKWEATLEPFVKAYSVGLRTEDDAMAKLAFERVETEVRDALSVAYEATHRAIEIMRTIEPAEGVTARWATDVRDWTDHARRCTKGIPRFARRHDALRAAQTLQRWSSAADALETQQAFDDPMVMARLDAVGRCISGHIDSIDDDNREVKPGQKNRTRVPLIELTLTSSTRLLAGEVVRWTGDKAVKGVLRSIDGTTATIAIMGGQKAFGESAMVAGDDVMFVGLDPWEGQDPWAPDEVPWTHRETTSELAGDETGDPSAGNQDDSPDMTAEELAEVPVVGLVAPGDEPGVVV
jgi:hypothetical protein